MQTTTIANLDGATKPCKSNLNFNTKRFSEDKCEMKDIMRRPQKRNRTSL
jgi:hypothetical protein